MEAEKTGSTCTLAAKEGRKPRSLPYGQKFQFKRKEPSAKRQKNLKNAVTASFGREEQTKAMVLSRRMAEVHQLHSQACPPCSSPVCTPKRLPEVLRLGGEKSDTRSRINHQVTRGQELPASGLGTARQDRTMSPSNPAPQGRHHVQGTAAPSLADPLSGGAKLGPPLLGVCLGINSEAGGLVPIHFTKPQARAGSETETYVFSAEWPVLRKSKGGGQSGPKAHLSSPHTAVTAVPPAYVCHCIVGHPQASSA